MHTRIYKYIRSNSTEIILKYLSLYFLYFSKSKTSDLWLMGLLMRQELRVLKRYFIISAKLVQSRFTLRFIQATKSVLPVLRLNLDLRYISLVPFLRHGLLYKVTYTIKYNKIWWSTKIWLILTIISISKKRHLSRFQLAKVWPMMCLVLADISN